MQCRVEHGLEDMNDKELGWENVQKCGTAITSPVKQKSQSLQSSPPIDLISMSGSVQELQPVESLTSGLSPFPGHLHTRWQREQLSTES